MPRKKLPEVPPITILSLGAGVQSSTMALMAAKGELTPMPVAAVFSDTGDEPRAVYEWLDWLEKQLPFPVLRVGKEEKLSEHIFSGIDQGKRSSSLPYFTKNPDATKSEGIMMRQCTQDFKIMPIRKAVKKLIKEHGAKHAIQWIGISLDESIRMKPSRVKFSSHIWPLIDKRMSRHDCKMWMERNGYPEPPRSACVYCPHHNNAEWKRIRDNDPEAWAFSVEFDKKIRKGLHNVNHECYLHRSCVPLDEVDLSDDVDNGQGLLWGEECEGMCGV